MKRIGSLLLLVVLLATAGCRPASNDTVAPPATAPTAAAEQTVATPASPPPAGADLMPPYPRAIRSADTPEERRALAESHPTLLKNPQQRAYVTDDTPAVVIGFYEVQMARAGWQLLLTQAGEDGGQVMWEMGKIVGTLQVAQNQGQTVIFLEWGEAGPVLPM